MDLTSCTSPFLTASRRGKSGGGNKESAKPAGGRHTAVISKAANQLSNFVFICISNLSIGSLFKTGDCLLNSTVPDI